LTETYRLRKSLNEQADGAYKLSVNDFIIKAAGLACRDIPQVNSSWHGDFIRQYVIPLL
jgi:pyruvate dehydrogenase E2 component (dihydrolipoamide acetyltransferase)